MDVDKRNEELDETIIQTCKWIQKKLQISDKSIRDEKVPEMMSALAELVSARNERGGIVYAKEVPMIKVKTVKEKNGKGTPLQTVIQYWTKDGVLVAEGRVNQLDEPEIN